MFQQNILQGPGTGTFTTHTFEILLMLAGAFLFGLWFGWLLWSRYRQAAERLRLDNESLNASLGALRSEMDGLKIKLAEAETERSTLASQVQNLSWENEHARSQILVLQSDLGKIQERNRQLESELGMSQPPDDEETNDIQLEIDTPVLLEQEEEYAARESFIQEDAPEEIIEAENPNYLDEPEYTISDDRSVPEAMYTTEDAEQWIPDLPPLEKKDDGFTMIPISELEATPVIEIPEEPETNSIYVAAVSGPRDDLKIVEGIGPKIEELLFKAGVNTYGHLAATSVQQLKDILAEAGPRFSMHDPGTWSAQALLAANGEWENLKAYQDFLNAGKRPDK